MSFKELEEIIPNFKDLKLVSKIFYKVCADLLYAWKFCRKLKNLIVGTIK